MTAPAVAHQTCIRGPRTKDQNYISKTWLAQVAEVDRDYSKGERWGQAGKHVDAVLDRDDTRCLIRHAPGDMDGIYAWIVYADGPGVPLVHFVYTRKEHRRKGYAAALLASCGVTRDSQLVYTTRGPSTKVMLAAYPYAVHLPLKDFL